MATVKLRACDVCSKMQHRVTCTACDAEMLKQEREFMAAETAKFARFKCRMCGGPCTIGRQIICSGCSPDSERGSDDEMMEKAPNVSTLFEEPAVAPVVAMFKTCAGCKTVHPRTAFKKDKSRNDNIGNHCKSCRSEQYHQAKRTAHRLAVGFTDGVAS